MVVCMVFGSVEFEIDNGGFEVALFGRFDTYLTFVDGLIEMIICYICYTMGSSSQLRRFDCSIQKNKYGDFEVRFRPKALDQSQRVVDDESNF